MWGQLIEAPEILVWQRPKNYYADVRQEYRIKFQDKFVLVQMSKYVVRVLIYDGEKYRFNGRDYVNYLEARLTMKGANEYTTRRVRHDELREIDPTDISILSTKVHTPNMSAKGFLRLVDNSNEYSKQCLSKKWRDTLHEVLTKMVVVYGQQVSTV